MTMSRYSIGDISKYDPEKEYIDVYNILTRIVRVIHKTVRQAAFITLLLTSAFVISTIADMNALTTAGTETGGFPGFDKLLETNLDTAAWIRMAGTHIDHPVLQGSDNYEYLDRDIEGNYYPGGSIFLDAGSSKDISDEYIVIHGHHMTRGAMFSDLACYLEERFFSENDKGELLTPEENYELTVAGVMTADAYDDEVYAVSPERPRPLGLIEKCTNRRSLSFAENDKLIALSTCSGNMTNDRIVVLCRARRTGDG